MPGWRLTATLAVLVLTVQFYGLYRVGGPPVPLWFPQADKVQHAFGFAVPVLLVLLTLVLRRRPSSGPGLRPVTVGLVLVAFSGHAVLSELIQGWFYSSRTGDPLDVLADLAGIALGWIGFRLTVRALDRAPVRA